MVGSSSSESDHDDDGQRQPPPPVKGKVAIQSDEDENEEDEDDEEEVLVMTEEEDSSRDKNRKRAAAVDDKDDTNTTSNKKVKSKKKHERPNAMKQNEELYSHFITLGEKFVSGSGKVTNCKACVCCYCQQAYDDQVKELHGQQFRIATLTKSKQYQRTGRICGGHIRICPHAKKAMRKAITAASNVAAAALPANKKKPPPATSAAAVRTTMSPSAMSALTNASVASASSTKTSTTKTKKLVNTSLYEHFVRPMSEEEVVDMEEKLIEMIVDCHLPFNIVERPSFLRFVASIRTMAASRIPGRTKTKEKLLRNAAIEAKEDLLQHIKNELQKGHLAGIIVDTWMNVAKVHLEGVILKAGDGFFALQADQADFEHHGVAVARGWEALILSFNDDYDIRYFLSDDAGQCGRARRILALRHPHMIFMRCWAHQINLMVRTLLELAGFAAVCKQAIVAATKITASSSKWMPQLKSLVDEMYGNKVLSKIYTVAETRWNTTQQCFASQLRTRAACKNFVQKYENMSGFPEACKVWALDEFWVDLEEAELLIRPFCDASYLMQRNKGNTLAHVVLVFLVLYNHVREYCGDSHQVKVMKQDLEKRWHGEDNPLFFLAFALHPSFCKMAIDIIANSEKQDGSWGRNKNALSVVRLAKAATFYYGKHKLFRSTTDAGQMDEQQQLDKAVRQWLQGKPSSIAALSVYNEGENAAEWWDENRTEYPEIAQIAAFLLDCPVQGAACERLFKDFALFHTKQRNRLKSDTVYDSTLVKHRMQRKYPEDTVRCASTKHTNRIVSADQYPRIDVPLSPDVRAAARAMARTADDDKNADDEARRTNEQAIEDAETAAAEDDDEDEGPSLVDMLGTEVESELDVWIQVLRAVVPADDSTFFNDDDSSDEDNEELYNADEQDNRMDKNDNEEDKDSYEVVPSVLLHLPTNDDKKIPQENKKYFDTKNYVRKDKYTLDQLLPKEMQLPPLSSIYKM